MDPFTKRIKAPDGLNATFTLVRQDKTLHQHAQVYLVIEADDGSIYRMEFDSERYTPSFGNKLISAFRFNPEWREHFRVFNAPHDKVPLRYADGTEGFADKGLAPYVQALNDQGYRTLSSCEGDPYPNGRPPFIGFFENIPKPLEAVLNALGWVNFDRSVGPIPCHGHNHSFRAMFLLMLDDWMAGELDTTAERYRIQRQALPKLPELPPVNEKALNDHQASVTKLVKKINTKGEKATFSDMVNLRSGRDRYSNWKLEQLQQALRNDPSLEQLESRIFGKAALQRALRWRMRGLDLLMILKKHEVDQVLEASKLAKKQALSNADQL